MSCIRYQLNRLVNSRGLLSLEPRLSQRSNSIAGTQKLWHNLIKTKRNRKLKPNSIKLAARLKYANKSKSTLELFKVFKINPKS